MAYAVAFYQAVDESGFRRIAGQWSAQGEELRFEAQQAGSIMQLQAGEQPGAAQQSCNESLGVPGRLIPGVGRNVLGDGVVGGDEQQDAAFMWTPREQLVASQSPVDMQLTVEFQQVAVGFRQAFLSRLAGRGAADCIRTGVLRRHMVLFLVHAVSRACLDWSAPARTGLLTFFPRTT